MNAFAWSLRDRIAMVAGVAAPLIVAAALVPFRSTVPNTDAALALVVVVVAIAANGNRLAGISAAVSAAVWLDFFLTRPFEHFTITRGTDIETTVLLLVVGAVVTELAVRGRRQRVLAVTDQQYLAAIEATAELAAGLLSPGGLTRLVEEHLVALLGLKGCHFQRTRFGGLPRLDSAGQVLWNGRTWDIDQYGMPASEIELLADANGRAVGRFVLEPVPGRPAPLAARRVAAILASQVGAALADGSRVRP
jgi:hypothetical protein